MLSKYGNCTRLLKLKNKLISRYFVGVLKKTIIPLALVRYEMIIANSYPTRTRGIIVNYIFGIQLIQKRFSFFKR